MRQAAAVAIVLGLLLAARPAEAEEPPAVTPEQAADEALAATRSGDSERMKPVATRRNPDAWLVADQLVARGEFDVGEAFAKLAPEQDARKLPAYVASRRTAPREDEARAVQRVLDEALAKREWGRALELTRELPPHPRTVTTIRLAYGHALALFRNRDLPEAAAAFEAVAGDCLELGWVRRAAQAFKYAGYAASDWSDWKRGNAYFQRAADLQALRGDPVGLAASLSDLGRGYEQLGEFAKSLEFHERALRLTEPWGGPGDVAGHCMNLGVTHRGLGNFTRALEYYRRALDLFEKAEDRAAVGRVLGNMAIVHNALGDHARALALNEEALRLKEEAFDRPGAARTLGNMGLVYAQLGDFAKALEIQERALRMKKELGDRAGYAATLHNISWLHQGMGRLDEALRCEQEVLDTARALDDRKRVASALAQIGSLHLLRGRHAEALEFHEEALALRRELRDRGGEAETLACVATDHAEAGDSDRALALHTAVLAMEEEMGREGNAADALGEIGALHLRSGRLREAMEAARGAVERLGRTLGGVGDEQGASSRAQRSSTFDLGTVAACRLGDAAEAVYFLESGRAGALLESLQARQSLDTTELPAELVAAERAARGVESAAAVALRQAIQAGDLVAIAEARGSLDAAREALAGVVSRIQREAKAVAAAAYPLPDSAETLETRLRGNEALVLYGLTTTDTFAVVVVPGGCRVVALGPTGEIERACAALRADDAASSPAEAARDLRRRTIDPLGLDETTTRVLVSPDGALSYVPFALLQPAWEVVHVPSGTTYGLLLDGAAQRGRGVLAVGDPDYGAAPAEAAVAMRGGHSLVRLAASADEAKAVGTTVLLGADATEAGLREALAKKPRWRAVHFACHGLVDPERPMFSSLALTPAGEDDGFLTALEVFRMKVPADLAVLSACETGKGKVYRAEGIVGLTRAFMFAGAPRVLVSLWDVDDEATRALMTRFYERWNAGAPAATALRDAQTHVSSQEKWKHPRFWAAWVLWGLPD